MLLNFYSALLIRFDVLIITLTYFAFLKKKRKETNEKRIKAVEACLLTLFFFLRLVGLLVYRNG